MPWQSDAQSGIFGVLENIVTAGHVIDDEAGGVERSQYFLRLVSR